MNEGEINVPRPLCGSDDRKSASISKREPDEVSKKPGKLEYTRRIGRNKK